MATRVRRRERILGAFDDAQILQGLSDGTFVYTDLGQRDGDLSWRSLAALFPEGPTPSTRARVSPGRRLIGVVVLIGVVAGVLLLLTRVPEDATASHAAIYVTTTDLVSEHLKSPASAVYPSFHENGAVSFTTLASDRYEIRSYVDSRNSFGAMLRTRWTARVRVEGDRLVLEGFEAE